MHHRRKEGSPLTTRGASSRIMTMRLPYDLEEAVKAEAEIRGLPWQTVMKDLIREALGIHESATEVKMIPSTALRAASRKLKKKT